MLCFDGGKWHSHSIHGTGIVTYTLIPWDSTIHESVINIPFVPWRLLWDLNLRMLGYVFFQDIAPGWTATRPGAWVEFSTSIWDIVTNQTTKMNISDWVNLGKVTQLTDLQTGGWLNHHSPPHKDMPLFLLLLQVDVWWILFLGMYILPSWKWVTQA